MHHYFIQRILHKRSFQIALLIGTLLSLFYLIADVFPNRLYGGSPYTRWIESFTGSEVPQLLFMLMPIISAMAAADIYAVDKKNGFFAHIYTKNLRKKYFINLYGYNFLFAGLIFVFPLLLNIYGCFMLLPNHPPDLLVTTSEAVPQMFSTTLFPALYYAHPFLHILLYVGIAFLSAGMYAAIALSVSFFVKSSFLIFLSAFIIDYIWTYLIPIDLNDSISYFPTVFSRQISTPILSFEIMLVVWGSGALLASVLYVIGVKKYVVK
ncbi:hypothetical protein ACSMFR_12195 [Listeria aquatica]|uniref:hypothetical protein n=1 Tax=Listeria aquatica TaxID=1494960 RepID=UPI003F702F13